MKKSIIFSLLTASYLMAGNLTITKANVLAHSEVFGDSTINPATTSLTSRLTMEDGIESIRGTVDVSVRLLKSDNATRDEHMIEALESNKYPLATYKFTKVTKSTKGYIVNGILNFHGIKKPLNIKANIIQKGNKITFNGKASFKMTSFGVTPPKLLVLTVRDKIDLSIDVTFKKK